MGGGMSAMGGGNSRSHAGEPVVPPKIRPMLARRFDDMKKRKGAAKLPVESTLSKKQLLKQDTEEYDSNSQHSNETHHETKIEDKVSAKEIQQTKEEMAKLVITPEKQSRVVPLPNIECKAEEEKQLNKGGNLEQDKKQNDHDDKAKVIQVEVKAETEVKTGERDEKSADTKSFDDNDDDETEELSRFLPGSPSFRIYCIEAEKRKEEEGEKHTIAMHQKCPSADSILESAAPESPGSENLAIVLPVAAVRPNTKRKGNKTKKFGVVRTLFKVKSCYYPMCSCTGDQRRNIVAARAAN